MVHVVQEEWRGLGVCKQCPPTVEHPWAAGQGVDHSC